MNNIFAGIEAGGTKFVCAVGTSPEDIRAKSSFATSTPQETIGKTKEFFQAQENIHGKITAIGVASFGPLDPNPASPTYGYITSTPKPGWANFDFISALADDYDLPIKFDTDVNGAALGEYRWGAAQGLDTFIYLTIGTGIGGGGLVNGKLMHGLIHPEMGHIPLPHDFDADPYKGGCPFHRDCLEGLANGPAIQARWGQPAESLPSNHPAWALEANYLALGLVNFIYILSPQRIIMGGGVMKQSHLFPLIRKKVLDILNDYVKSKQILEHIDDFIVPPALGSNAGVLGALALAELAMNS
jgi:fructokinase